MLDLEKIRDLQVAGVQSLKQLQEQEQDLLIAYCALAAQDVMRTAQANNVKTSLTIANAFQFGFGLGLKLKIENGQIKERT